MTSSFIDKAFSAVVMLLLFHSFEIPADLNSLNIFQKKKQKQTKKNLFLYVLQCAVTLH